MATKVPAPVIDFIGNVKLYLTDNSYSSPYGDYSFLSFPGDSVSTMAIFDNLTALTWNDVLYDETNPSFNLKFKSTDTTPASTFTINHKVTGDYKTISDGTNVNGSISDVVSASYQKGDKLTSTLSHSIATKFDRNGDAISEKTSDSNNTILTSTNNTPDDKTDDFVYSLKSSSSSSYDIVNDIYTGGSYSSSESYKSTNLSYTISDGAKGSSETYSFNDVDNDIKITSSEKSSETFDKKGNYTQNISSASYVANSGDGLINFNLTFSGSVYTDYNASTSTLNLKSFKYDNADFSFSSGAVKVVLDGYTSLPDFSAFKFDKYSQGAGLTLDESITAFDSFLPLINGGDNKITLKTDGGNSIDAGAGKDQITGFDGDDTLFGGAGNDTISGGIGLDVIEGGQGSDVLTGGKDSDMFKFSSDDFYDVNANDELVFNKSVDTVKDFNLVDGDKFDFGDLGTLFFYNTLADAKADFETLFYVKGSGNIYYDAGAGATVATDYNPVVIITITGKPAVNADLTDWNYPA